MTWKPHVAYRSAADVMANRPDAVLVRFDNKNRIVCEVLGGPQAVIAIR